MTAYKCKPLQLGGIGTQVAASSTIYSYLTSMAARETGDTIIKPMPAGFDFFSAISSLKVGPEIRPNLGKQLNLTKLK